MHTIIFNHQLTDFLAFLTECARVCIVAIPARMNTLGGQHDGPDERTRKMYRAWWSDLDLVDHAPNAIQHRKA